MPDSLFITGATGFIGSALLAALEPSEFTAIRVLVRGDRARDAILPPALRSAENVEIVRGRLEAPESYAAALDPHTLVVHAAAITGAARVEEYEAVNVGGVERLLAACRERGVRRLLHLSTIAVCYPSLDDYPYARTKRAAEALVRASELDYTIVRPTIVADPESAGFQGLVKLATAPALIQPGCCRARLAPIDLPDLVDALVGLIRARRFSRETFDLGGAESLTVLALMRRIRARVRGREGPTLRLPLRPLLWLLRGLEALWPGSPPVTAGQFAVFRFDGEGEVPRAIAELGLHPAGVDAMLARALPAPLAAQIERDGEADIALECRAFSQYLLNRAPDAYLLRKYGEALRGGALPRSGGDFEELLLRLATRHPLLTRAVDVYARWLHPRALVRKRLILVLAIAESWAPSYAELDRADEDPLAVFLAKMTLQGAISVALLIATGLLLHPLKLLLPGSADGREVGG